MKIDNVRTKITKGDVMVIGYIRETFNGRLEVRAPDNKPLDTYDQRTDRTMNITNRTICFGNALSALVMDHARQKGRL